MLNCIACSKELNGGSLTQQGENDDDNVGAKQNKKQPIKTLTTQIKGMALRASSAYKNCNPCGGGKSDNRKSYEESNSGSGPSTRFHCGYQRTDLTRKELDKRVVIKGMGLGLFNGEETPVSVSGRSDSVVFVDEDEPKEWVAQVEPGVLITFMSLPRGVNDLRRIRFSRELFNKWQAQRWWAENYDKVMELYNVPKFNQQIVHLVRSQDENSNNNSTHDSPTKPPFSKQRFPQNFHRLTGSTYSSSNSLDPHGARECYESFGLGSTPKLSNISGSRTETSSMDASTRSSFSRDIDHSGELSASDIETEWVEQDEPGVYITIRALANGTRELQRVRFSREKFGEMHARLWWEENKARIQEQYL